MNIHSESVEYALEEHARILSQLDAMWGGTTIEVVSDYNGQPCGGSSRPSLRGQRFKVIGVDIQHAEVCVHFHISHTRGYGVLPIQEVRVVEDARIRGETK